MMVGSRCKDGSRGFTQEPRRLVDIGFWSLGRRSDSKLSKRDSDSSEIL